MGLNSTARTAVDGTAELERRPVGLTQSEQQRGSELRKRNQSLQPRGTTPEGNTYLLGVPKGEENTWTVNAFKELSIPIW